MTQPNTSKTKDLEQILLQVIATYQPEILELYGDEYPLSVQDAKQEILKHFKALISESKPEELTPDKAALVAGWMDEEFIAYNQAIDQFESNLLKRVEEM